MGNMDSLGDRMKGYENCYRNHLPSGFSVIMRVDGRAFHNFTKSFYRPFDTVFMESMKDTAKYLCENIQGAKFAYVQSDEISVLIDNPVRDGYTPWFGNNIQKMVSVGASMATLAFNQAFAEHVNQFDMDLEFNTPFFEEFPEEEENMSINYHNVIHTATFDARVFLIPKVDVPNYFLWRMKDAERNSLNMVARSLYSHKELAGKKAHEMHDMIHAKGQNWNDYPADMKRGTVIVKGNKLCYNDENHNGFWRHVWEPLDEPPHSTYEDWEVVVKCSMTELVYTRDFE